MHPPSHESVESAVDSRLGSRADGSEVEGQTSHALPRYNIQLALVVDDAHVAEASERMLDGLAEAVHASLACVRSLAVDFAFSTRILRHVRLSHEFRTSQGVTYLPVEAFKRQVKMFDEIASQSSRSLHHNLMLLMYVPPSAALLRTQKDLLLTNASALSDPAYISGYEFTTGTYELSLIMANAEADVANLEEFVLVRIRQRLGFLSSFGLPAPSRHDCLLSIEEETLFIVSWIGRMHRQTSALIAALPALFSLPHHTALPRPAAASLKTASAMFRSEQLSDHALSALPGDALREVLRTVSGAAAAVNAIAADPRLHNYSKLTREHLMYLLLPFWVPLLAPLIKWLKWRFSRQKTKI